MIQLLHGGSVLKYEGRSIDKAAKLKLYQLTAHEAVALLRRGEVSATEMVEAVVSRQRPKFVPSRARVVQVGDWHRRAMAGARPTDRSHG